MSTTLDIQDYLIKNSPWVHLDKTVDTVKIGDPSRTVKKAGVCWYPALATIKAAHAAGCDLLITHEPTFWEHAAPEMSLRDKEPGITKRRFLEETGMVVLRAHDSWDNWPELGIRDSWAKGLGFTRRLSEGSTGHYLGLYVVEPQPLREFARYVAQKIAPLGEDSVQVMGDPERIVSRPSIGVGCISPNEEMVQLGSDVLIMCFDGATYWSHRERMCELGAAVITVEHGTTEMWGLETLCRHLSEVFQDIQFQYFAEHPRTWTVRAT